MRTIDIRDAESQLSRLVDEAADGEPFVITVAGKPMVKVTALDTPAAGTRRRLGFMAGQFKIPNNFDRLGSKDIAEMFGIRK